MNHLGLVASLQVPEDRSIIEESQVDHVFAFLELWWIHFSNIRCFMRKFLMTHSHDTFGCWILNITRLKQPFAVSSSLWIRDPYAFLRIVYLGLVCTLHLDG